MFPSWCNTWVNTSHYSGFVSRRSQLEAKLKFFRSTRDDLETRLAATRAAIEQIEQQLSRED